MHARARGVSLLIAALGVSACGDQPARPAPPNIVLVTLDTTRADHLGCYGATGVETPNLDRLAAEGVRFATAVTPVPQTLPAHCTIMTGRTPPGHTVRVNGDILPDDIETLAEALKASGYETAAFVGSGVLSPSTGLRQGFDTYDREFGGGPGVSRDRRADEVVAALEAWLPHRNPAKPLFVWMHFYDAHAPYDAPEPYGSRFGTRPYDGEIAFTDACLGRALAALEKGGALPQGLVVVAGDHGEGLGEHGEATHSVFLYESTLRVPLLLRWPGHLQPAVVEGTARLQDLSATMLDAAGLPPLPGSEGASLLAGVAKGRINPPRPSYLESMYPWQAFRWGWVRGLRSDEWKYIDSVRPELYQLSVDPHEERNLLVDEPARGAPLAAALEQAAKSAAEAGANLTATFQPDAQETLRALGYTGSSGAALPAERPPRDPKDFVQLFSRIDQAKEVGFGHGDPRAAIGILQELEPLDPTNPEIALNLGLFSQRIGDNAGAEVHLARALELDPNQAWANLLYAINAGQREDYATAEARFREGLRRIPRYAQIKLNLALLLAGTGRMEEAEKFAREATEDNPGLFDAWDTLGEILAADPRRRNEALAAWDRAAALRPGSQELAQKQAQLRAAGAR